MFVLPRHDLMRAEVDVLHAKCFAENGDISMAHESFVDGVKEAFSPLTEHAALSYAEVAYHADIKHIEQYFNVERNGWCYDIVLIIAEKGDKCVSKKLFQKSYKCVEKAMEVSRVLNTLFSFNLE